MGTLLSLNYLMKCLFDLLLLHFIYQHKSKIMIFISNPLNILKCFFIPLLFIIVAVRVGIYGEILYPAVESELDTYEGICCVEGGTRYNKIFINGKRFYFGIMSMGKNNNFYYYRELDGKRVKVLYKGKTFHNVYQLEVEGKVIYSLVEANNELIIYNINIITMPYILTFLVVFLFFLERSKK